MSDAVNRWKQMGRIFLWRYPRHRKKHEGWHFTAEEIACDQLIILIDAMRKASGETHRTIALTHPDPAIWSVPNFGAPLKETLGPMTLHFAPSFDDLQLVQDGDRMLLRIGEARADELLDAIRDVHAGEGDYAIWPNQKKASPPLWFWWMPRRDPGFPPGPPQRILPRRHIR